MLKGALNGIGQRMRVGEDHFFYKYRRGIYLLSLLLLPFLSMLLAEGLVREGGISGCFSWMNTMPALALYNYIIYMAVYGLLLCLINRLDIASIVYALVVIIYSFANYYKLQTVGFYASPLDLLNQSNMGEAVNLLIKYVPVTHILLLLLAFVGITFLFLVLQNKFKLHKYVRIAAAVVCGLVIYMGCNTFYIVYTPVNSFLRITEYAPYNPSGNFELNGMLATFLSYVSYDYENQIKPDGYGQQAINDIIDGVSPDPDYEESSVQPDKVIIIMAESLVDPGRMEDIDISPDPLADMRPDLVGSAISPTFGGSTGNAEFEAVTGLSLYPVPISAVPFAKLNRRLPSLAWYFKELDYQAVGIHTHMKSWYRRNEIYPLLGFDSFISSENMDGAELRGLYISDQEMARQIIKHTDNDEKQFIFAITMENHGPYLYDKFENLENPPPLDVQGGGLSEEDNELVTNYLKGVYDANEMYKMLKEHFEGSGQKVVIALFGDHAPYIGDGLTVTTGFYEDDNDMGKRYVPLLLWSNYLEKPEQLDSPISFNYIGAAVSRYCGLPQSKFMQLLSQLQKSVPVLTTWPLEDIEYNDLEGSSQMVDDYSMLVYDALYGQSYADKIYEVGEQ